jgi:hypothetical protein
MMMMMMMMMMITTAELCEREHFLMNDGRQALQPADPQLVGRVRVGHLHDASQQV